MKMYDRIIDLCQRNNINGTKLGELLNLKKSPLTDWKNGKSKPTVEQVVKMCEIFAVSTEFIILGKDSESLNHEEEQLLQAYRMADPAMQAAARKLLDIPAEQGKSLISEPGSAAM